MRASVVVVTKNQRGHLERSLPVLLSQQNTGGPLEVIVVDSGSTDGAQDVVRSSNARLVEIESATFNYARAHNAGAAAATGELVVRLSGDALPLGTDWLSRLLAPFSDPAVAASWGGQVLPPGLRNPVDRLTMRVGWGGVGRRVRRHTRPTTILGGNMAFRRALWRRHAFDEHLPQAEDYAWTFVWQRRGYATVFVPDALVCHGHDEPLAHALTRALAQSALQGLIRVCLR